MNLLDSHIEEGRDLGSCLDKLLKFSYHLVNEIYDDPYQADYYRGEDFVDIVLGFLVDMKYISREENVILRNNSIENAIFRILEKLLEADYFIDGVHEIDDCSYDLSRTYAIHIYTHLGKLLNRNLHPFNENTEKVGDKIVIDRELEQETFEVISILLKGNFSKDSNDHIRLYSFFQFLYNESHLTEDEFINVSCTDDIEETLENVILKKLIAPGKITNQHIVTAFYQFSNAFTESQRKNAKNKVDGILTDNEEYDDYTDLEESNFLSLLQKSADILCNLEIREGDLYDFDCFELIAEATCYDILTPDEAQEMIDMLEKDESKSKVQIIFQIFQKFYDNDFVNTLDIAEDDRKILKSTTSNYLYALNMLASTGTFN